MKRSSAALLAVAALCVVGLVAVIDYDDASAREVRVENVGDEAQTATVTVTHGPETLVERTVSLDPGESVTVYEVRRFPRDTDTFLVEAQAGERYARGTFAATECDGALVTLDGEPNAEAVGC